MWKHILLGMVIPLAGAQPAKGVLPSLLDRAHACEERGEYRCAEEALVQALTLLEETSGMEQAASIPILKDLAGVYLVQGKSPQAGDSFRRALRLATKHWGPSHLQTAGVMSGFAMYHWSLHNFAKAEEWQRRAVVILERELGKDHHSTAIAMLSLGLVLQSERRWTSAEKVLLEARRILGTSDSSSTKERAMALYQLGLVRAAQGRHADAEPMYREAIALIENALIENAPIGKSTTDARPELASYLNGLAKTRQVLGAYAEAEGLNGRALAIAGNTYGTSHLTYAAILADQASILRSLKRHSQASEFLARARAIRKSHTDQDRNLEAIDFRALRKP